MGLTVIAQFVLIQSLVIVERVLLILDLPQFLVPIQSIVLIQIVVVVQWIVLLLLIRIGLDGIASQIRLCSRIEHQIPQCEYNRVVQTFLRSRSTLEIVLLLLLLPCEGIHLERHKSQHQSHRCSI